MLKNAYLGLFVVFVLISSVSVFAPGMPQPADAVLALLILVLATTYVVPVPANKDLFLVGGLFLAHVSIISLYWYSQLRDTRFLFHALYYTFNFGGFLVIVSLVRTLGDRFVAVFRIAIAIAIGLEIVALFVLPPSAYRTAGTFNNPNQLGYWGLMLGCCLLVLKRDQKLSLIDFAVLCGGAYLTMASLSKAAMLSFAMLLVTATFFQRITRPVKAMFFALAFLGSAIAVTDSAQIAEVLSVRVVGNAADRLGGIGKQDDDSLAGRGYDRIWRHPEYLIFGAGEGATWRFSPSETLRENQKEMHSTLGTVLFSYGIIGFSLFCALLLLVFWRAPLAHAVYSLPIWAYGMTHQGLRDTMLWVFLGLVFGLAHYGRTSHSQDAARPAAADGVHPAGSRDVLPKPVRHPRARGA